ncbi:MAG: MmcQ/YjbR family DNA-binding protein [Eubacteriales bacterium]|nr:MmcQ/YjbR family DNA-binding protein [Eubacteriales bacterium]
MNLSKKLKYSVLLPIIAFMAVAIALCACIGIKGADVGMTAEAASMTITPTEQPGHTHDGMYFETDLNASFAANQTLSDVTYVTNSYFPGIQIIKYGVIEVDSSTGEIRTQIEKPSVTGLVLYEEWYKTSRTKGDGSGTIEYYVTQKYHYDISGGTYYLSANLNFSQNYINSLPIYVNGEAKICLNGHTLTLLEDTQFEVMSGGITLCGCDSDGDGVRGKVITSAKKLIYSSDIRYRITVSLQNVDIECKTNFSYWDRYHYMMIAIQFGDFNMSNVNFTYTGTKDSKLDKIIFLDIASFKDLDTELNNASVGENVSVDSNFYFQSGPAINMDGYNNSNPIFVKPREIRVGTVVAENATDDMVEIYDCDPYVDLGRETNVVAIIPWGIEVTLNDKVSLDAVDGGGDLIQTGLRDVPMTIIYLKANDGYQLPMSLALPMGLVYTVSEDKLTATISGKPTDDQVQSYNGTPIAVTVNGQEYVEPHIHDGITFDRVMDAALLGSLSTGMDETTSRDYKILTAGNYFLNSGDVSLTADIRISGQVNICLNGNNIVCGEYRFVLAANASLNIYGCNGGAFVKNGYSIFADNAGTSLGVHGGNAGRIVTVNPIDVRGYTGKVNVMFRNLTSGTTVLTNGTKDNLSLINAGSFDIREEGGNVVVYVYGSVTITLVGIELAGDNSGALVQTNLLGEMTPVKVKAIDGKYLPDSVSTKNGIVYTNNGDGTATISGTPSGDVSYALAAFDSADGHVHDGVTFGTALTLEYLNNRGGYIDAGNYYLAEDITWYGSLYINDAVNICLNGNKFRYACTGDSIRVGSAGTLGIYGCCGGELTNSDNSYQYLFYVEGGGKFNLFGGTVSSIREQVINLTNGASFTMTGGSVINNYTSTESINMEQQVSVYANSGSAVKITNGTVKGKLYVWNAIDLDGYAGEAIPLYNGNITTGCVLANNAVNADVISLINDGYMQDYVADNKTIIAAGAYTVTINLVNAKLASTSEGALYQKVKVGEPFKPVKLDILGNYDETASEIDGTYFKFNLNEDGTVATIMPTENTVSYPNQYYIKVVASIPHKHNDITFTALNSDDVYNSFNNGGNYYLTSDVYWDSNYSAFTVRNNLSICLNGYSITIRGMYPQIMVADGATLRIFDCNESGKGSIRFYREYVSDTSSYIDPSAINIGYGLLEIYGGTFLFTYENYVIGGINVGGMSNDGGETWVYGNIAVYGGNLKNFLNSDGYCIRGYFANNNIKISGGTLGKVYVKSAIEADGYDGNALSVYYGGISNGVTVLKNSTVDKLNLLNDGYYAKQSGTDVIAVLPKTVTVTLEHATVTDEALLTQTVGGRITDIVITAEDGYVLPATLDIGHGLTYTLAPDGLTATISGEPTEDTMITVTCEVADSRTPVDIPSAGSKDYTGETLISDLVDTELYTVTTNAGGIVAGEYDVVLTLKDNTSYKWATGDADDAVRTIKFVINKATNEWTTAFDMADWTYGTTASDPIASAKFGTVVFTYATAQDGTYSNVKPVNAGTYWVKATVEGTDNYTALTDTKSFVIATVKVAKPVADTTVFTYDGTEKTYTVAANDAYTVSGNKQTNAGTHMVTVTLNDKVNYEWADNTTADVEFTFTINKAVYDMSGITFENGTAEYDGQAHSLTISGTLPTGLDGITVTVSYTGSATSVSEGAVTVTATFATDSVNYNVPEAKTATITITQATNAWTATLVLDDLTYGSTFNPTASAKFGEVVFAYATEENGVYESAKPVNAGTYWVKATVAETADYTGLTAKKSFVIDTVKVAKPEADSTAFTYDGTEKTYTVATNAAYSVSNNTRTLAGSQTVTVALNDKDNYEWTDGTTTDVTFDFVIAKAVVDVPSAGSKEYTGSLLQSDIADTADYTVTKNDGGTSVGYYDVVVELIDNGNFKWNDDGEDVAERTIQFLITKKLNRFTVELSMDNWTYGETAKEPSATALIGTVAFTYSNEENGTYSDTKPSAAGTYWVKAVVAETEDYEPLEAKKSFTIYTVKVNEPAKDTSVFSYNGAEQTYVVAANDAYTVSSNKQTNAGNHTVTIALIDKNNYEWTTAGNSDDLTYAFNIGKNDYDMSGITFENGTAEYDGQAHSLTISGTLPTGLDGITVTVSYTGSATSVSQGAVTVTATFATDSVNYNVPEVKTATITITQATNEWTTALDMAGWSYGNTASDPVAEAEFGAVAFAYATEENGVYESAKPVNAGTYWVKATVAETADYTGLTAKKSFVIDTVKVAKPVADTMVFTYNKAEQTYAVTPNADYTVSNNKRTNAGSQIVTVALNDKVNYEWADNTTADVTFTFTINKAAVEIPSAGSKDYTGERLVSDLVDTELYVVTTNNGGTNAGEYDVLLTLADDGNYKWATGNAYDAVRTIKFVINKVTNEWTTSLDMADWTYGTTASDPVAEAKFGTVVFTYATAQDGTYSNVKPVNAGTYWVKATVEGTDNYTALIDTKSFVIATVKVAKPEADSTVFTYNKAEQTYAVAGNALYTVSGNKQTNAGTHTVTVALNNKVNYEWADNTTADVEFTFTINKAVYDMSNVTFADKSIKADGNAQNIVIGGTLPEGVTVRYEGNGKTEPGVYTVTAIFTGDADNYEAIANKTATLTVLSAGMSESVPGNDTDKPDAIIESDNGLDPNLELVVEEITTKESVNKVIKKNEVIEKAYEVTLKSDGVVVQPDGTLTVKLLLPETLRGKEFRIISSENGENLQETEYTIEGDYVVFSTDRIAEFSFVSERDDASSLLWLIILLSILLLLEILLAIYKINKDRKDNREIRTYAIAPFVLAAAFPQAQVTAVIVLAILDVICGAYDAYLYLRRKREPEEELEDTSEDDARNDMLAALADGANFETMNQPNVEMDADLKVVMGMAKASSHKLDISKKKIADHLKAKFGDSVEVNNHPNYTKTNLPLSDNHYVLNGVQSNGRTGRVCFVYVYELEGGKMFLLVKTNAEHAAEIMAKHPQVMRSRFPRNGEWYSVIIDESFRSDDEVYEIVDKAKAVCERK